MDAELEGLGQAELAHGECEHGDILVKFLFELRQVADVIDTLVESPVNLGAIVCTGTFSMASIVRIRKSLSGVYGLLVSSKDTSMTKSPLCLLARIWR